MHHVSLPTLSSCNGFFMPSPDVSLPKQPKVDPEFFVEAFLLTPPLATGLTPVLNELHWLPVQQRASSTLSKKNHYTRWSTFVIYTRRKNITGLQNTRKSRNMSDEMCHLELWDDVSRPLSFTMLKLAWDDTVCYSVARLSGLSPFAGSDDQDTLHNVRRCDWKFDDESFRSISDDGKDFIKKLLVKVPQ